MSAADSQRADQSRIFVLWSAHTAGSRSELERWAREQLPVLRSADGVHEVWLRRVSLPSPLWNVEWEWAFELHVSPESVAELCDRGLCSDLLADMRLLGMRPVAMLLNPERE
jgi:hypothetical protein